MSWDYGVQTVMNYSKKHPTYIMTSQISSMLTVLSFKEPSTSIMEGIINLHNDIFGFLILISVIVISVIIMLYKRYIINISTLKFINIKERSNFIKITDGILIEMLWTIIPCFILLYIAIPSFILLYASSEYLEPNIIIKVIGHQWYWNIEYTYLEISKFIESTKKLVLEHKVYDSYMKIEDDLKVGELRLLETNTPLVLPISMPITAIVTSTDVIHSWALPNLGIKIDAVPGRLNQISFFINKPGVYYGQCSEICGVNHGFMPITMYAVKPNNFYSYFNLINNI
jgi:cytochrome c oxidase subunit 2